MKCFIVEKREEQIIRCISEMFHCREKRRANYCRNVLVKCFIVEKREEQIIRCIRNVSL